MNRYYWETGCYQGRIHDLWLGGAWVGEEYGDRLRSPAGPRQSPGKGPRGAKPPGSSGGFEELQTFIWTTILNQPHAPHAPSKSASGYLSWRSTGPLYLHNTFLFIYCRNILIVSKSRSMVLNSSFIYIMLNKNWYR
jgi:hypothetical protein